MSGHEEFPDGRPDAGAVPPGGSRPGGPVDGIHPESTVPGSSLDEHGVPIVPSYLDRRLGDGQANFLAEKLEEGRVAAAESGLTPEEQEVRNAAVAAAKAGLRRRTSYIADTTAREKAMAAHRRGRRITYEAENKRPPRRPGGRGEMSPETPPPPPRRPRRPGTPPPRMGGR